MFSLLEVILLIAASIGIGASGAILGLQFLDDCISDYRQWRQRS